MDVGLRVIQGRHSLGLSSAGQEALSFYLFFPLPSSCVLMEGILGLRLLSPSCPFLSSLACSFWAGNNFHLALLLLHTPQPTETHYC